jgi:glycosyltransferase involved in cell wall biosynthesis
MWRRISCVSISVAGDCFTKGADIKALSTEYLGVNTTQFNDNKRPETIKKQLLLDKKNKIILSACRIINEYGNNILAEKGVINLIESFSKISPNYPNLKLLIAIGKPPENLLVEFNIALKMLNGYILLRNIAKQTIVKVFELDEMPNVYHESDIFVLASQNETFGQVFIEAMACGVPVIGTKVGGIPEIISDSYNGYLVLPDDASVLAQRIETILNNRSIRDRFIKTGKQTIKDKFTLEKQFSNYIEMLKNMVKK